MLSPEPEKVRREKEEEKRDPSSTPFSGAATLGTTFYPRERRWKKRRKKLKLGEKREMTSCTLTVLSREGKASL